MRIWKAIYVASRSEKKVAERLMKINITVYLPIQKTVKQWSDRKKIVAIPLLPGYVFVNIEESELERFKVLNTLGVVAFVMDLGKDAVIPEREISVLRNIENLGYTVDLYEKPLSTGDKVLIVQGVLKNQKAEVLEVNKDGVVYAFLLEGINQCVRIKIPKDIVEVV